MGTHPGQATSHGTGITPTPAPVQTGAAQTPQFAQCAHPCAPVGGDWVPGEILHQHGENVQTLRTPSPGGRNRFFFSHQHYNEMALSERILEDLLNVPIPVKSNLPP